ncbi:MAG: carotenoid biosynthesis protein [Candidatus Nitrosotenuis sp.]|nr:MAG: carotenoid biosynthesis protein [Candidatus Nitrosotenuis sp.]
MSGQIGTSKRKAILTSLAVFFLALFVYSAIIHPLLESFVSLPQIPGGIGIKTILMMSFSLIHAWYVLGWKRALMFFAITAIVSWGYEQVGVETGIVYGKYHYTDVLGTKLGHVPIIIPIAWFMMIYPSFIIANLITFSSISKNQNKMSRIIWLSIISAIIMTAWDLVIDPYLSGPTQRAWVWESEGQYFGVPLQNFVGWIATTFTIYFLYLIFERKMTSYNNNLTKRIMVIPVLAYGIMMISNIVPGEPSALRFIGPIVMGIPLSIALWRLLMYNRILNPA